MNGPTITIELKYPIEVTRKNGDVDLIEQIEMRRPMLGDMENAQKFDGQITQSMALISFLSGVQMSTLRKQMDGFDFFQCDDLVQEMVRGKSQRTGEG